MRFMGRFVEALIDVLGDDPASGHADADLRDAHVDEHGLPASLSASERDTALAQRWGTFDGSVPAATPYTDTD